MHTKLRKTLVKSESNMLFHLCHITENYVTLYYVILYHIILFFLDLSENETSPFFLRFCSSPEKLLPWAAARSFSLSYKTLSLLLLSFKAPLEQLRIHGSRSDSSCQELRLVGIRSRSEIPC